MVTVPCLNCKKDSNPAKNIFCPHCSGKLKIDVYESMKKDYDDFSRLREDIDTRIISKFKPTKIEKLSPIWYTLNDIFSWVTIHMYLYTNYLTGDHSVLYDVFESKSSDEKFAKRLGEISKNFRLLSQQAFMVIFMFQIESFLDSIDENIPNSKRGAKDGFSDVMPRVLKFLNLKDYDKSWNILKTIWIIRNCYHADGFYIGKDDDHTKIDKYIFHFKNNQRTSFRSWHHLHFFAENSVKVLEEICDIIVSKNISISVRMSRYCA